MQHDIEPPIYRATILGNSLQEVIDDMIRSNDLQEHHKEIILAQFDRTVLENFRDMDRPLKPIKISGNNTIYNFVEECHKFKTREFELKGEDGFVERSEICHIISINARGNPIEAPPVETPRGGQKKKKGGRRASHH